MHPDLPDIPGYEIYPRRALGVGGFARVYLARHKSFQLDVALKIMDSELAKDPEFCSRFLREGRICAKLGTHPHIMNIYDIGCVDDAYYFSMQLLTGPSLQDVISKKPDIDSQIANRHPLELLRPVVLALGYAHRHGFVHRDIKPANLLFNEEGDAMLSDFGIAKSFDQHTISATGAAIGTPSYMSPEQATAAEELDGRSDIYSLGVVLFELLTGERPYKSDTPMGVLLQHVNAPVPQLPERENQFQPLVDKMMAKDPADRYANSEELLVDVDYYFQMYNRVNQSGNILSHSLERLHRWRIPIAAVISAFVLVVAMSAWIVQDSEKTPPPLFDSASSDPEVVKQVESLWSRAELFETVGDLVTPPGSNALEVYEQILAIDPDNTAAQIRKAELISQSD